jgi:hypothetical protein
MAIFRRLAPPALPRPGFFFFLTTFPFSPTTSSSSSDSPSVAAGESRGVLSRDFLAFFLLRAEAGAVTSVSSVDSWCSETGSRKGGKLA